MTIDHDFDLEKKGRRKGEWIAKILIKSHAFPLDHFQKFFFENGALFHVKYLLEKKDRKCKRKFVFNMFHTPFFRYDVYL